MAGLIFVFGSNLAGRHGAGAALFARQNKGAEYGVGEGHTGQSYALPTKDENIRTRPITDVAESVGKFMQYATEHPELQFEVTKVGCGLAGFKEVEIAPLFKGCPENCILPEGWRELC